MSGDPHLHQELLSAAPSGSDASQVRRRFLMVWRRDADGRSRIARELLNEDV